MPINLLPKRRDSIKMLKKDLGKIMGKLMPMLKGSADGKNINKIASQELSKLK